MKARSPRRKPRKTKPGPVRGPGWTTKLELCRLFGISQQHFDRSLLPTIPATARREQAGTRAILFYGPVVVENRVQLLVLTKLRDAATRNRFIDMAKEELYNCMTGLAGELTQIAENLKPGDGKRPIRKSRG